MNYVCITFIRGHTVIILKIVMTWHELDAKTALNNLGTSKKGLSKEEAEKRLEKYGLNELKEEKRIKPTEIFVRQFADFLVIILIAATIFSAFVGEILDSTAIFVIVILNAIFGFLQEYKAEKSMEALKKLAAQESIVIRDGKKVEIPSKNIVPGDIVVLEQGDKVPADLRLIEVSELKIDESAITGESIPVKKSTQACKTKTLAEMKCMVFMGTAVTYGRALAVVTGSGMNTEVGKIAHLVHSEKHEQTPLQRSLDKFGKNLGLLILCISVLVIATGLLRGGHLVETVIIGVALAVAAIPEGLPAIVTVTLAIGMQKMAKKNAIVRKLQAVEALGSVSVICADKTGTLTKNEMTVRKIWLDYKMINVMGNGYEPKGDFILNESKVEDDNHLSLLLRVSALCTNAQLKHNEDWNIIGDPTEGALIVAAEKFGLDKEKLEEENPRKYEFPFTSERKMMSTINRYTRGRAELAYGSDHIMCTKGAPEVVLKLCSATMRNGRIVKLPDRERQEILDINKDMTSHSLRVLAIAYKESKARDKEDGLIFLGLVGMIDPPREEAVQDIKVCKDAGIKVVMITGDHLNTALAIAKELGIEGKSLTGEELEALSEGKLEEIVEDIAVYARVNPEHKANIVDAFKKRNHIIAMTGDGVNDAPALKKADVGVAMGIKGTDVAKEASDIVLTDDNFSSIVAAVKEGRNIYDNIKTFILYLLSSNAAEVMIVFAAIIIGFNVNGSQVIPLTAIQLLWINLITDGLPALALGIDPPLRDVMKRKPRDPKERLLSREVFTHMFLTGIVMAAIVLIIFAYNMGNIAKALTLSFTTLVLLEMINVLRIRVEHGHSLFSNHKLIGAVASSVLLQLFVVYTSALQPIFDTVPLTYSDWLMILSGLLAFTVFAAIRIKTRKHVS